MPLWKRPLANSAALAFLAFCGSGDALSQQRDRAWETLIGDWLGEYRCGPTKNAISISVSPSGGQAYFPALVSLGSGGTRLQYHAQFMLNTSSQEVYLKPTHWVRNRSNYIMIGLTGRISSKGEQINGRVIRPECQEVSIQRLYFVEPDLDPSSDVAKNLFDDNAARKQ